jgi:hypothetical protein
VGYIGGIWEYMAYKHCLELGERLDNLESEGEFTTVNLTSLKLSAGDDAGNAAFYCPQCSTRSSSDEIFCQSCGTNLQSVRMALSGQMQKSGLKRAIDQYVRKRSMDKKVGTAAGACLVVGLLYSLLAGTHHSSVYAVLSVMYIFIGLWDLLVYRRSIKAEKEALKKLSSKPAKSKETHSEVNQLPSDQSNITQPVNITGELTRELSPPIKRS